MGRLQSRPSREWTQHSPGLERRHQPRQLCQPGIAVSWRQATRHLQRLRYPESILIDCVSLDKRSGRRPRNRAPTASPMRQTDRYDGSRGQVTYPGSGKLLAARHSLPPVSTLLRGIGRCRAGLGPRTPRSGLFTHGQARAAQLGLLATIQASCRTGQCVQFNAGTSQPRSRTSAPHPRVYHCGHDCAAAEGYLPSNARAAAFPA